VIAYIVTDPAPWGDIVPCMVVVIVLLYVIARSAARSGEWFGPVRGSRRG
jgi:hypothetical protein